MSRSWQVSLGETPAGAITAAEGQLPEFRLYPAYIHDPDRPVLGQVFEDDPARAHRALRTQAPRWFGNLLPEEGSRLRSYLGRVGGIEPGDDLGLLEFLGQDLPGAVKIEPLDALPAGLASQRRDALDNPEAAPALPPPGIRISLAGVQLKFSVVAHGDRISLPARSGEGNLILKVAGQQWDGLAANEAAMMFWAAKAGFDVAESRVVLLPDLGLPAEMFADAQRDAYLVRRFDRQDGLRIHQEDLAQVTNTPVENKYTGSKFHKLAPLVRSVLGERGLEEYLRRLTLMVAQGNADAHLKNWSIRYADRRLPAWSPLYDQVSTIAWPRVSADLALELSGARHLRAVTLDSLRHVAALASYPPDRAAELAVEVIDRLRAAWPEVLEKRPLPAGHRAALAEHWRRALLLRSFGLEP